MKTHRFLDINISFILIFILVSSNILACSRQQDKSKIDDEFISDSFEGQITAFFDSTEFISALALFDSNDTDFFSDDFASNLEDIIFDSYSEYIDGVYVSVLTPEEYKNTLLLLESGEQLNINKIIRNVAIGTGAIILTSILLPALAPGLAPRIAIIVTKIVKDALMGAALDAGIRGAIEYAQSRNIETASYRALEGASEGFMWGAIISSVATSFTEIKLLKQAQRTDKTLVNFSENVDDLANKTNKFAHFNGNKLRPNQKYFFGYPPHENIYIGYSDELGRISRVEATNLQLKPIGRKKLKLVDNKTPGKIIPGDEAGHLIGDLFDGSPYLDNLVSMSHRANSIEYAALEREWANALRSGKKVSVNVNVRYEAGSLRPSAFNVEYTIDGEFFEKVILNTAGKL